jgi:hypothetical protein
MARFDGMIRGFGNFAHITFLFPLYHSLSPRRGFGRGGLRTEKRGHAGKSNSGFASVYFLDGLTPTGGGDLRLLGSANSHFLLLPSYF